MMSKRSIQRYSALHWNKPSLFPLLIFCLFASIDRNESGVSFEYGPKPEFVDSSSELNVTAYLHQTARLPCRVKHLGGKKVSWIRGRDLQVLSSSRTKFVRDIRISILPGTQHSSRKSLDKREVKTNFDKSVLPLKAFPFEQRDDTNFESFGNSLGLEESQNETLLSENLNFQWENGQKENLNFHKIYKRYTDGNKKAGLKKNGKNYNDVFSLNTYNKNTNKMDKKQRKNRKMQKIKKNFLRKAKRKSRQKLKNKRKLKDLIMIQPASQMEYSETNEESSLNLPYNYLDTFWEPEDYTLQIKYTKRRDTGTYLCQINTDPRMTQIVNLQVVEMIAKIEGPKEIFVKEGSPIILNCKVNNGTELPGFIFWYKDGALVDYGLSGGRIKVDMSIKGQTEIVLTKAVRGDSGNYSCVPSGGQSDSVSITVIPDKRPEAVQQNGSSVIHISRLGIISAIFWTFTMNFEWLNQCLMQFQLA